MNPIDEPWLVSETQEDEPVIYVKRALPCGMEYAHVLFQSDWAETEVAQHAADLHNAWLAARETL